MPTTDVPVVTNIWHPPTFKGNYIMSDENLIFIYDRFTHQKLLIDEETLVKDYRQYHDWLVYESFTGNPSVSDWLKAKEDAQKAMAGYEPIVPRNPADHLKPKEKR